MEACSALSVEMPLVPKVGLRMIFLVTSSHSRSVIGKSVLFFPARIGCLALDT